MPLGSRTDPWWKLAKTEMVRVRVIEPRDAAVSLILMGDRLSVMRLVPRTVAGVMDQTELSQTNLTQVVTAGALLGRETHHVYRRQKHRCQDRNDADHNEEFDERKGRG